MGDLPLLMLEHNSTNKDETKKEETQVTLLDLMGLSRAQLDIDPQKATSHHHICRNPSSTTPAELVELTFLLGTLGGADLKFWGRKAFSATVTFLTSFKPKFIPYFEIGMLLAVEHLYRQQEIGCCNERHFPYYLWQNIFSAFTGNFKTCLVGHHLARGSAEVK